MLIHALQMGVALQRTQSRQFHTDDYIVSTLNSFEVEDNKEYALPSPVKCSSIP